MAASDKGSARGSSAVVSGSLRTYVAWDPAQYDTMVTKALEQDIQASQTLHLPALDPTDLLAQLQQFPPN